MKQTTVTYPREGITPGQPGIPGEMGEAAVGARREPATVVPTYAAAYNQPISSHLTMAKLIK
jgi:hypothetical protein